MVAALIYINVVGFEFLRKICLFKAISPILYYYLKLTNFFYLFGWTILMKDFVENFSKSDYYIKKKEKICCFFYNPFHVQAVCFALLFLSSNSFNFWCYSNRVGELIGAQAETYSLFPAPAAPAAPFMTAPGPMPLLRASEQFLDLRHVPLRTPRMSSIQQYHDAYINRAIAQISLENKIIKTTEMKLQIFFFLTINDYLNQNSANSLSHSVAHIRQIHPCLIFAPDNYIPIGSKTINEYKLIENHPLIGHRFYQQKQNNYTFYNDLEMTHLFRQNHQQRLDLQRKRLLLELLNEKRISYPKEYKQTNLGYFEVQNYYNKLWYHPLCTKNTDSLSLYNGTYNVNNVRNVRKMLGWGWPQNF